MNIGIVGFGFVGKSIYYGSNRDNYFFSVFDVRSEQVPQDVALAPLDKMSRSCPIIFVCVPTPTNFTNGQVDLSIIEDILKQINHYQMHNMVVIKSTVPPGSCDYFAEKYDKIKILFCPEFLTEANAVRDYAMQDRVIIGMNPKDFGDKFKLAKKTIKKFFKSTLGKTIEIDGEEIERRAPSVYFTNRATAETVKYITNAFLSVKVSFFNEVYDYCQVLGIDYDILKELVILDDRVGHSHTKVPGPDGERGYGGKCLAKDALGLISSMIDLDIIPHIIGAAWAKNLQVRERQDWLEIDGAHSDS